MNVQVSPGFPCMVCGDPGYVIPAPMDWLVTAAEPSLMEDLTIKTANTCPLHVQIVRLHLVEKYAPRRAAYRDGRP